MKWIITGILLAQVVSCAKHNEDMYLATQEHALLPEKVRGACDGSSIKCIDTLNKSGVTVITVGQNYLISIPAKLLFAEQTPHINWHSYGTLNTVATLLKQYRKIAVDITSYSIPYISVDRARALTLARSRVVGEYLWSQGIDSRFVFTHGVVTKPHDSQASDRVEITFRDAVA